MKRQNGRFMKPLACSNFQDYSSSGYLRQLRSVIIHNKWGACRHVRGGGGGGGGGGCLRFLPSQLMHWYFQARDSVHGKGGGGGGGVGRWDPHKKFTGTGLQWNYFFHGHTWNAYTADSKFLATNWYTAIGRGRDDRRSSSNLTWCYVRRMTALISASFQDPERSESRTIDARFPSAVSLPSVNQCSEDNHLSFTVTLAGNGLCKKGWTNPYAGT